MDLDGFLEQLDERYLLREDQTRLVNQMAELEIAMAGHFDKLNTLAARLRKRDQRASEGEKGGDALHGDPGAVQAPPISRAELKRQLASRIHGRATG